MIRHALMSCLVAVGLLIPVAGHAQAAACTWQRTDFEVPPSGSAVDVRGVGGDYAVGQTQWDKAALWYQGKLTEVPPPVEVPDGRTALEDVNTSGTAVGTMYTNHPDGTLTQEVYIRRPDGTHQFLGSSTRHESAEAINDRGDILGRSYVPGGGTVIVYWSYKDYSKYRVIGEGYPVGLSESGNVVVDDRVLTPLDSGLVLGRRLAKPDGAQSVTPSSVQNDVIAGRAVMTSGGVQAVTWNANGSLRSTVASAGEDVYGVAANNNGVVLGLRGTHPRAMTPSKWRNGVLETMPVPAPEMDRGRRVFINDQDVITGTYLYETYGVFAAQWRCR